MLPIFWFPSSSFWLLLCVGGYLLLCMTGPGGALSIGKFDIMMLHTVFIVLDRNLWMANVIANTPSKMTEKQSSDHELVP